MHPGSSDATLILTPNKSLTWKQSKLVFLFFAGALGLVTVYFSLMGAWLVIPFTGLELLVLGTGIYLQCHWAHQKQTIHVGRNSVRVTGWRKGEQPVSFPLHWFQIKLLKHRNGWYPSRLIVGSHGRFIEIGSYLIDEEREHAAEQLRSAVDASKSRYFREAANDDADLSSKPAVLSLNPGERGAAADQEKRRRVGNASQL